MSPQQRRLDHLRADSPGPYLSKIRLRVQGELDPHGLECALEDLVHRHALSDCSLSIEAGPDSEHLVVIEAPACRADGFALRLLSSELFAGAVPRPPYAPFARAMAEVPGTPEALPGRELWRRQNVGSLLTFRHPFERDRPLAPAFAPALISMQLPVHPQRELALACWLVLLWRWIGKDEILVGVGFHGRNRADHDLVFGPFHHYLPLPCSLNAELPLAELVEEMRHRLPDMDQWQDCFVWEDVTVELASTPFFSFGFDFDDAPRLFFGESLDATIEHESYYLDRFTLRLRLCGGFPAQFHFDANRLAASPVQSMAQQYCALVQSAMEQPERPISRLNLLTAAERQRVVVGFNRTEVDYGESESLVSLIEQCANAFGDEVALVSGSEQLTFRGFRRDANQLAHRLRALGAGRNVLVAVALPRSTRLVTAIIAILKTGAAWMPLDPDYPSERLRYMLEDAQPAILVTETTAAGALSGFQGQWLLLDASDGSAGEPDSGAPECRIDGDETAYVIYTSGSTGRPKGTAIPHRGLRNRLLWMQQVFPIGSADRVLQKTPATFDVSVWELLWPLITGARLVLARPDGQRDCVYLRDTIVERGITILHFVPSMLREFLETPGVEQCTSLRHVIASGESLTWQLKEQFFERLPFAKLHNLYGPTEASIDVTFWTCTPGGDRCVVPIGRPIANTRIHIVDSRLESLPVGVPGELCIAGVGLASGYLNRPDLTAAKFVHSTSGERIYRTGDLARYAPDGTIEFLGRIDNAFKIRGFRVEPEEVEWTLRKYCGVSAAAVIAAERADGNRWLIAYVVSRERLQESELRALLRAQLPDYMVPSQFVFIDALPLTPNGKVDRSALAGRQNQQAVPNGMLKMPATDLRSKIAVTWCTALGIANAGYHDNFFDLGGHSLLLVQVHRELQQLLNREFPATMLFEFPTISSLAEALEKHATCSGMPKEE